MSPLPLIVSVRVADMPNGLPGATKEPCTECEAPTWLSRSMRESGVAGRLICSQCMAALAQGAR